MVRELLRSSASATSASPSWQLLFRLMSGDPRHRAHEYGEVAEVLGESLSSVEPRRGTWRRRRLKVAERLRSRSGVDVSRVVQAVHGESAEPRPSQEQLFDLISDAAVANRPILVEAPTGTGKSLAALAAALDISGLESVVILSGGTDGTDGPTDAAGALCDGTTLERAEKRQLQPLEHLTNNNAYPFFKELGDLIMTGPTNTNVIDLRLVLVD